MSIKSSQSLVQEALKVVKTILPEEALEKSKNNQCNLIDIRDDFELERDGKIENAIPIANTSIWVIATCDLMNNGSSQIIDGLKKISFQKIKVVIACAIINKEKEKT